MVGGEEAARTSLMETESGMAGDSMVEAGDLCSSSHTSQGGDTGQTERSGRTEWSGGQSGPTQPLSQPLPPTQPTRHLVVISLLRVWPCLHLN